MSWIIETFLDAKMITCFKKELCLLIPVKSRCNLCRSGLTCTCLVPGVKIFILVFLGASLQALEVGCSPSSKASLDKRPSPWMISILSWTR